MSEPIRRATTKKILGHGGHGRPTPPIGGTRTQPAVSAVRPTPPPVSPAQLRIDHIKRSIADAIRGKSNMDLQVTGIRGFSTSTMRHLFNNLLNQPAPMRYLEVGAYCGGTFCAAISNNPNVQAVVFEDFSQPFDVDNVRDQCLDNIARFNNGNGAVVERDFFGPWDDVKGPFDMFFYDGNHDEEWQAKALPRAFDLLADTFIMLVDDYNWESVRNGTGHGIAAMANRMSVVQSWELRGKSSSDDSMWHNGVAIFLCRKTELEKTFLHNGDMGDAIAALPVIRSLGGGRLIFTQASGWTNPRPFKQASDLLTPLFAAQPYIRSVEWQDYPGITDYDFCQFRNSQRKGGRTLTHEQSYHIGVTNPDMSPWLHVVPDTLAEGRVIVARSPRYRNPLFPWNKVAAKYGDAMLFVGLDEEHAGFQAAVGRPVERYIVKDYLDLAQMIAGSRLFVGNQSSPVWVAMGLGHTLIQETSTACPNSTITRPNAQFVDGRNIPHLP